MFSKSDSIGNKQKRRIIGKLARSASIEQGKMVGMRVRTYIDKM
jgi:hypothetical protein